MLSKLSSEQCALQRSGFQDRGFEWRIEPRPQIPGGQQVEAEQGGEVRETPGPGGLQLEKFQQSHRDPGDPDLGLHSVLTRPYEGFDLGVLLSRP